MVPMSADSMSDDPTWQSGYTAGWNAALRCGPITESDRQKAEGLAFVLENFDTPMPEAAAFVRRLAGAYVDRRGADRRERDAPVKQYARNSVRDGTDRREA